MSSFIPSQGTIGQAFAIAGLALVAPSTYFFRNYSRVLDYVQMFYIFAIAYASTTGVFSLNLQWGCINFMRSFIDSYCNPTQFLCLYGFLISPGVCWFGVALLMLIILGIAGCKNSNVRYQGFYNFWKGFFRWFSVPLAYFCTTQIITSLQSNNFSISEVNFDASIIIAAIIFFWMFVELIGLGCVQKAQENNWKKWCDFFSNFRIISVVALVAVSLKINTMAQYFIYGPIVIYDLVFLVKYKFTFKYFERFVFIIQEGVLITIFSLFIFNNSYITNNNLDLLGLALVILLQMLLFFPKLASSCKNEKDDDDPMVNPERRLPELKVKINKYQNLVPENSRSNLNQSPRPSPGRRR